ncbi:MAG: YcxB family protein [Eubacterium sp.]|nr:YcxB family protein [Eubacterium sp.]
MKVLFKNTTVYTKKLYLEAQEKWYRKTSRKRRWYFLLMALFCVICALYYISKVTWAAGGVFIAGAAVLILAYFKGYRFSAEKVYNSQREIFPEKGFHWVVTKDKLHWKTEAAERDVYFKQISAIYETKHSFVLVALGKLYILDKAGFTAGDSLEFKRFMMNKCPRAFR